MLESVRSKGTISKSEAAQIQRHLNFASGFFVSKALRFLVSSFSRLADLPRSLGGDDLSKLCSLAVTMLKAMLPRVYVSESFKDPFFIFTDGAWDDVRPSDWGVEGL